MHNLQEQPIMAAAASRRSAVELFRRRSDVTGSNRANIANSTESIIVAELPWGALKIVPNMGLDFGVLPAKFSASTLMLELFAVFERKMNQVCNEEPLDKPLNKTLRRGEDVYLDNLFRTLNGICEMCLPSVLAALIKWYESQQKVSLSESGETRDRSVKKTLAASYLFCIALIEVLPQIHFHPTDCEQLVQFIINTSFNQISYRDPAVFGNNYNNYNLVAETFSEVIGVLSLSHSKLVHKKFVSELNELRKENPLTSTTVRNIISLLMGMKFFRIKTQTYLDFEMGVNFLDELGSYFLEVDLKQKDLKHALAGLLVEILLPVAAQIKTEANIPALIAFVEKLYGPTYDLVNKKQHKMAAYPLLTCLLCISQSKFFLSSWVQFLNLTLANLKNKDPKISRVALESLYRLLWVYIIRNSCEGNTATRSRLESICGSLFPRGNRNVIPRDAPLNIFVKIIHFIAQQKLDFAFKEIIFDLLGCNRASRSVSIYPERMNIGIRSLMVIADGLQQKDGPPGMPRSIAPIASGTIQRQIKKTYITRPLTAEVARSIGLEQYYMPCRKAFDAMLRTLDSQVGRPLMLTVPQTRGKEYEDIIVGDVKPKLDLLRTCIAAVPRLLPEPMSHQDLIDMLVRMCVHIDEELRATAYQTLQNLVSECVEWREEIIHSFLRFLTSNIQDTFPTLLESTVRFLLQLLCTWRSSILIERRRENQGSCTPNDVVDVLAVSPNLKNGSAHQSAAKPTANRSSLGNGIASSQLIENSSNQTSRSLMSPILNNATAYAMHCIEGFAIVLLCQLRQQLKKIGISMLKEVKQLLLLLCPSQYDTPVIEVLDDATSYVVTKYMEHISLTERQSWNADFATACEKICNLEADTCLVNADKGNEYLRWDPWACALSGYSEYKFLLAQCPTAVSFAWPALFSRLNACAQFVDPSNPQNESRGSLLRNSKSKSTASTLCKEALSQDSYLSLWQKYLVMCFSLAQPTTFQLPNSVNSVNRSFSPSTTLETADMIRNMAMSSSIRIARSTSLNCSQLFQKVANMLRWENMTDMRDSVVLGIGSTNPVCFELLLEELNNRGLLREAQDKKIESNVRRRKRKDLLRLQLLRVFEVALFRGLLEYSCLVDHHSGLLSPILLEFIDSIRQNVESDVDRDIATLTSLRLHFAKTVMLLINGVSLDQRKNLLPVDIKHNIFTLFFSWCSRVSPSRKDCEVGAYVEQKTVLAMCALNCCGSVFESPRSLNDEENLYRWLEALASYNMGNICEETLCLMLHLNEHYPQLFEWTIRTCYTKADNLSSKCFRALAMLFSKREYPCEFVSLFVLCQVFAEDADPSLQRTALLLLQILRRQFLDSSLSPCNASLFSNEALDRLSLSAASPVKSKVSTGNKRFFLDINQSSSTINQLSKTYTQLTMPIFSEVCYRIESARHTRQTAMLTFLLQWLKNIELVDPNCEILMPDNGSRSGSGWGSEEATQLLLTNMLYLTAKLGGEHNTELFTLWKCIATSYPPNLPIIVQYLFVMITLGADTIIPVANKICVYLLNSCGDRLISILMEQLPNVGEPFKLQLLRCEMPPFYRWVQQQSPLANSSENCEEAEHPSNPTVDGEKVDVEEANHPKQVQQIGTTNEKASVYKPVMPADPVGSNNTPKQLPMPPYGGHYARLLTLLPPSTQVVPSFSRNNLTLFLLCDLIGADVDIPINWSLYAPTILHMSMISLDSHRPIMCSLARRAIINICLIYASKNVNRAQIAVALISHQLKSTHNSEVMERFNVVDMSLANSGAASSFNTHSSQNINESASTGVDTSVLSANLPQCDYRQMLLFSNETFGSAGELLLAIVHCLSHRGEGMWPYEEASSRCWKIESAEQLGCLTRHIAEYMLESEPNLAKIWTAVAMNMALSTSNRHLAGRSFQVAGALCQNPAPFINRVLSRLVEVVGQGDQSEETQSYITDLMLCIQSLTQYLVVTPNRESAERMANNSPASSGHSRSISYTPALLQQLSPPGQSMMSASSGSPSHPPNNKKDTRHSLLIENGHVAETPLNRSKSATMLKLEGQPTLSEEEYIVSMNALCQLISIAVAMLESSVDNEFLLALHLLDKVLHTAGTEKAECLNRLEKTMKSNMEWSCFPGIVGLVTRGAVFPMGYEPTISILTKCVAFLNHPVVGPPNSIALIVVSILPHCLLSYESPSQLCCGAAQAISDYCSVKLADILPKDSTDGLSSTDHPLHNLATMMDQYKDHSFPRDRFQWTKCVVNYLIDAFNPNVLQLVVFITEMMERSASSMHIYLLNMINLFVSYGDLSDSSPVALNAQVIRVISRYIQGVNSREASRILKSFVDQWNAISVTQVSHTELCTDQRKPNFELYVEKTTSASSIPSATTAAATAINIGAGGGSSPQTPRKANQNTAPSSNANPSDSMKRQNNSAGQSKVRERLISLLTASGLRVGLPKSSSVIFSQSTNDLHQDSQNAIAGCISANNMQTGASNSAYSSSERVSHQDDTLEAMSSSSHIGGCQTGERSSITTDSFPRVFKEFDFLEAEHDSISESTDSCFNWLSTMRSPRCGVSHADGEEADENAGDEHDDDFLHPEDGDYYEEDDVGSNGGHSGMGGSSGMNKDDEPATLRSKVALRSGRVFNVKPRRPLSRASRASDSNDISSDRTPLQSEKSMHSDDSCPSCPVSEEDDEEDIGEEDEDEPEEPVMSIHSSSNKNKSKGRHEKASHQSSKASSKQNVLTKANSQTSSLSPAHSNYRQPAGTEDSLMETASSIQCRSEFSGRNRMAFSPVSSVVSNSKMPIYLECNHHTSGQVEQMWNSVVLEVSNDQDGELTSHSIMLFSQLLRESCVKMSVLLRDASHLLTMPGSLSIPLQPLNETSAYFTHALNVVLTVADCPFLFATPQFLRSSNLLQTQKFALYELREHFETFSERREQCIRALNSLKSSLKLFSIGNSMIGGQLDSFTSSTTAGLFSSRNQEIELCKCLHKLFFQLLLMLEKLYEMIQVIQQSSNSQEYDLSPAVACLQRDLLGCLSEVPASQLSSASIGSNPQRNVGDQPKHSDTLVLHLANKQYKNALMSLRQLRCQYGSEEYGCCDHMDVEVLLVHFCRSHTLRTWAIVGNLQCLKQSCSQLKETNMQLAGLVRLLMTEAGAGNNSSRGSRMFGSAQQQQQMSGSVAGSQAEENTTTTSN